MLGHRKKQTESAIIHLVRNAHFVVMCSDSHARPLHQTTTIITIVTMAINKM